MLPCSQTSSHTRSHVQMAFPYMFPCSHWAKVYMFCNFGTPKSPKMFNIVFQVLLLIVTCEFHASWYPLETMGSKEIFDFLARFPFQATNCLMFHYFTILEWNLSFIYISRLKFRQFVQKMVPQWPPVKPLLGSPVVLEVASTTPKLGQHFITPSILSILYLSSQSTCCIDISFA